jgi:methylase of polypeptide subunit release factors
MDKQTVEFEPNLALYWWKKTWFELYEKLIYQILELKSIYNTKSILLFIEIGFDQKETSESFINKLNLNFEIFKDNRGIHRCIKINF